MHIYVYIYIFFTYVFIKMYIFRKCIFLMLMRDPEAEPIRFLSNGAGKSVFFVVWSFLLFGLFGCFFFCGLVGGVFFFCCLGGGPGPAQTAKK